MRTPGSPGCFTSLKVWKKLQSGQRKKIAAIRRLSEHTTQYVRAKLPKIYSHELVNLIFELPYCRIISLTEAGIAKRQTASQYLKQLVKIGVLAEAVTTKEKLFVHPKLMQLLTRDGNDFTLYINETRQS